jgi:glycosyltransferase involved in cell wall biosynthesis
VQFPGLLGNIKRRAFAHALNRIDRIVVVTNDARENHLRWLPALRRRSQKVATIVHGVDIGRFTVNHSNGDARLRDRLGIPRDAFLIGFLGRLMEQKGFHYLAEALDRLLQRGTLTRPVHLLVVGSGDCLANYRDDLSSLPHVSRCLTFMDRVPNVMPVLVELDLLAMPSLWEACGLLAMEGMCAGVPVLGSDCIGLREVLAGTPSPMVPAANVEALAAALEQAIRSPWTEAAGRYAPEARKRFDVAPAAARLQQLFDELADR